MHYVLSTIFHGNMKKKLKMKGEGVRYVSIDKKVNLRFKFQEAAWKYRSHNYEYNHVWGTNGVSFIGKPFHSNKLYEDMIYFCSTPY